MNSSFAAQASTTLIDGTCYVKINDERFDYQNSQSISEYCINLLDENEVKKLALDFENVNYITTSGIGSLLDIYYKFEYCHNSKFLIYNVNNEIQEVLNTTMVDRLLNVLDKSKSASLN